MTYSLKRSAKAMTAIAAVLAFSSTQSFAQDTAAPPDPVAETSTPVPESADPLAPEPAADTAVPPAPKPKVSTATTKSAKTSATSSATRTTARRATTTAPAAAAAPAPVEAPTPTPLPVEAQPPLTAQPGPMPVAEPTPAPSAPASDLIGDDMLPIAGGAAALGLIALGGAGYAMRRRRRRREDEEFEARQQALAEMDDEPTLELDRSQQVGAGPIFARTPAPMHDPVPVRKEPVPAAGNWQSRPDAEFMIRRAGKPAKDPVDQH